MAIELKNAHATPWANTNTALHTVPANKTAIGTVKIANGGTAQSKVFVRIDANLVFVTDVEPWESYELTQKILTAGQVLNVESDQWDVWFGFHFEEMDV
jgi:hypothetical protein